MLRLMIDYEGGLFGYPSYRLDIGGYTEKEIQHRSAFRCGQNLGGAPHERCRIAFKARPGGTTSIHQLLGPVVE